MSEELGHTASLISSQKTVSFSQPKQFRFVYVACCHSSSFRLPYLHQLCRVTRSNAFILSFSPSTVKLLRLSSCTMPSKALSRLDFSLYSVNFGFHKHCRSHIIFKITTVCASIHFTDMLPVFTFQNTENSNARQALNNCAPPVQLYGLSVYTLQYLVSNALIQPH